MCKVQEWIFQTCSMVLLCLTISSGYVYSAETSANSDDVVYSFGVVPQYTPRVIASTWRPVLNALELKTGFKFKLTGSSNIPGFETKFMAGEYDLAYMNPYHSLVSFESEGYLPLVRDGGRKLYGIVVVKKDSPIQKLSDLEGRHLTFPAPNALGASLMVRATLLKQGITFEPHYAQTHSSVYLNVTMGMYDAGGGVMRTYRAQPENISENLRIIYETEKVSPHPVVSHPRVPKEHVVKIQAAFLELAATDEGRMLLEAVALSNIVVATVDDYQSLKQLGIDSLYEQ